MAESGRKPKKRSNAGKPISLKPLQFDEAVSDLLKVKPEDKKTKPVNKIAEKHRTRQNREYDIPKAGTRLKGRTSGKDVYAEVVPSEDGRIRISFNGKIYRSMTGAAFAATGYSVDGWLFWKLIQ